MSGTVTNFSNTGGAAGDKVLVQILDSTNTVVAETYTDPTSGAWSFDNSGNTLADGKYSLRASIVDAAGNVITSASDQPLVIDTGASSNPENTPSTDPNTTASIAITGISTDTGTSASDYITSDNTLTV